MKEVNSSEWGGSKIDMAYRMESRNGSRIDRFLKENFFISRKQKLKGQSEFRVILTCAHFGTSTKEIISHERQCEDT